MPTNTASEWCLITSCGFLSQAFQTCFAELKKQWQIARTAISLTLLERCIPQENGKTEGKHTRFYVSLPLLSRQIGIQIASQVEFQECDGVRSRDMKFRMECRFFFCRWKRLTVQATEYAIIYEFYTFSHKESWFRICNQAVLVEYSS